MTLLPSQRSRSCLLNVDDPALKARLYATLGLEQYMAYDFEASDRSGRDATGGAGPVER